MKILFCCLIFTLLINIKVLSQLDSTNIARNTIYFEVGGAGGYFSLNYERALSIKNKFELLGRFGLSTYHIHDFNNNFNPDIIIPFTIHATYGSNHKVDMGAGQVISNLVKASSQDFESKRSTNLHTIFYLGYRYQRRNGGLFARLAYTPIIEYNTSFRHWASLSLGYTFKSKR